MALKGWQSAACLGLWKAIKLATRASDAFVFPPKRQKNGRHQEPGLEGHVKASVPFNGHPLLNPSAPDPFLWFLTFPLTPIVCSPCPAFLIPSCLLLTNSQPLLPHFPLFALPFLYFPPSYIISTPFRTQPSSAILPASKQPIGLPWVAPAVWARVLRAPSSHASPDSFPSQRRPGSPPPDRSRPSLPHFWPLHPRSSGLTTPPQPPEGRARERTRRHPPPRTPRPITGPAAAASSRDGLCRPRCRRRRPSPGGKERGESESRARGDGRGVPRAAGLGGRAGGQVGRQAAEGGRLQQTQAPPVADAQNRPGSG